MKKSKKRGRKRGIKNKIKESNTASYLIELHLTCKKCKKVFNIVTNKKNVDEVYTKEVKKKWRCGLC